MAKQDTGNVPESALNRAGQRSASSTTSGNKYNEYKQQYRSEKAIRKPFKLYTAANAENYNEHIWLWVNPSECSWRIPLRTSIEQIQGGAIHHEWGSIGMANQEPTKFDQPVINFSFQAGNLLPGGHLEMSQVGEFNSPPELVPPGLANFYDFCNLLNQPNILSNGQPNYVTIEYVSLMYPSLVLRGYFSQEGVQWSEQADNSQTISSWGASFVVFTSFPPIYDRSGLNSQYIESIFNS